MSLTDERIKERPTSKAEPMDWSTTRSETSLPSPVRSRSRSGSPSPPRAITINLFPLSDSIEFAPKHLSFNPDQEIKVGRVSGSRNQKEAKPDNGVFSCDVMSREHALLKEENGKILIKDLKSTHGTFVNNVRLGDGTEESDWRTLNHGDVITFGHSVRRNQNLYKHLSAYIFYPKETRDDIHSPSNGTTPVEPISSPSTIKVERVERTSENVLPPSAITQEATSVANTGGSQSSMLQSRNEGPASYYIAKSGGLSSNTSNTPNVTPLGNKFGGLPVTKPRTTDNITQASEALVTESKQNSTTSNTSEEMLTSIQKLKIGQSDENSHTKVEKIENKELAASSQEDDGDIYMENNENFQSNNVESGHKLVSPEITPETNPVGVTEEATVIQTATRTTTTVSFVAPAPVKDRVTTQVTRETKQSKASRKEKESRENNVDKDDKDEQIAVSNGEGPSHVTDDDSSTTSSITSSITSRKRKFDEVDDEASGLEVVNNLKEKIAALEDRANKRRKRDMVYSCVIGMVAGAFSIGACAYVFGA